MNERGFILPALIAIVMVAVLGVGAAVYFTQQGVENGESGSSAVVEIENGERDAAPAASNFTGTVTDLLKRGENLTCTFTRTDDTGNAIGGTVYVAGQGQRMRGDFVLAQADGTNMNGHIVRDGVTNYFWSDQLAQGTKMTIEEDIVASPVENSKQAMLDESVDYDCRPWAVDASLFTLPVDKDFIDISQQVQQLNTSNQDVKQAQCAACDQLQGAAKNQCLQALGC